MKSGAKACLKVRYGVEEESLGVADVHLTDIVDTHVERIAAMMSWY